MGRVCLALLNSAVICAVLSAQVPDVNRLRMEEWAANGMTKDPVALSFDNQGRLYLVETARRGSVDIDVRSHRTWLLDDLASDDFTSMRDFFRRRMATDLSDENKRWLQDRTGDGIHDYRDLTTVKERIRLVEDTDGDGKADKSTVYAEGFNEEFNGVVAGVMPYEGDVFMTIYPDLWRLRDLDGDGVADGKVSMFRGFGVHAAFDGHDLHGLTVGPEGKIYFSCGDNGFSVVTKEGKRLHYPNTGGVLRMNPDGSDLEVFATGLRNVQEFDFDRYGNMFAVDNDGDLEDERERAVYIAEGSDSGWRLNWQFRSEGWKKYNGGMTYNPWTAEGMWKPQHSQQPAYITPPMQNYSVGPGGFKFNPGTAINEQYRDFFFCVQFPVQQITAFRTRAKGAGFEMIDDHVFNSGLMVSSVNFGPDGGIYLADWIGKWQPNNEGIIYRVDDPSIEKSELRAEVKRLINEGVADQTVARLADMLGHEDRRVRQLAQFELVRRKRAYRLFQIAVDTKSPQLARIHAMWAMIQLKHTTQLRWLGVRLPWNDTDAQIRQQCARVAGELRLSNATSHLEKLLDDEAPLVRSHAAIALGKIGNRQSVEPLIALLKRNADLDPFIRHAAVFGLSGTASAVDLASRASDESMAVRMGAVLALRKQKSPTIAQFFDDDDLRVRREAARGAHDDFSIEAALPVLAELLEQQSLPPDEPLLRRIISANLRVGDEAAANRLARFVIDPPALGELTTTLQIEALQCLSVWQQDPLVDRVEGRIRKTQRITPQAGRQVLQENLSTILQTANGSVSEEALRVAQTLKLEMGPKMLRTWVLTDTIAPSTRSVALRLLQQQNDTELPMLLATILKKPWSQVNELTRTAFSILVETNPAKANAAIDWNGSIPEQQLYISQLPKLNRPDAERQLAVLLPRQLSGEANPALHLDVLRAADEIKAESSAAQAKQLRSMQTRDWGDFEFALSGGNAERGMAIYRGHVQAQCIRCHDAGGKGQQAGPMLHDIGKQDRAYLLESLIEPSAKIAKGFETITLLMVDGKLHNGALLRETDQELAIVNQQGKTITVSKDDIEDRSAGSESAMPKMSSVLTPFEVRDLVEYLSTLKP